MAKNIRFLLIGFLLVVMVGLVSASQVCEVYDDFSSGNLDMGKWEIRQDYEGQPLIPDSEVDAELENFHTQQENVIGDRRTYLVPTHKFKAGEIFEFDVDFISASGNSATMLLVDNQHRIGLGGCWDGSCPPFEVYHIKLEFGEGWINVTHNLFNAIISINSAEQHEIYVGTVFGHNGVGHIDYDNFVICIEEEEPEEPTLEERVIILEERVDDLKQKNSELENIISSLESLANKILEFIQNLPKGLSKGWVN